MVVLGGTTPDVAVTVFVLVRVLPSMTRGAGIGAGAGAGLAEAKVRRVVSASRDIAGWDEACMLMVGSGFWERISWSGYRSKSKIG